MSWEYNSEKNVWYHPEKPSTLEALESEVEEQPLEQEQEQNNEDSHEVEEYTVYRYQVYNDVKKRYSNDWTKDSWTVEYEQRGPFTRVSKSCSCGGYGDFVGHEESNICVHRYRVEYLSLAQHRGLLEDHPDFPSSWEETWN